MSPITPSSSSRTLFVRRRRPSRLSPKQPATTPPDPRTPPGNSSVGRVFRYVRRQTTLWGWTADDERDEDPFEYPNSRLVPKFGRRQATLIAISGVIGRGLFIGSGDSIAAGGPLGAFLGYLAMSSVAYGMVVSSAEMVAVFPYCRGTVGLADRFVDPALGFAMGWNAWYHWGITIPGQVAVATSLINYWHSPGRFAPLLPPIFVALTSASVSGAKIYGEFESVFAVVKVLAAGMIFVLAFVINGQGGVDKHENPFMFWKQPFRQYLGIEGEMGRLLGFLAVFTQAAVSFFGTEIPTLIAGEVIDAPNVIVDVARRVWLRITILYAVMIFTATTLVSPDVLLAHRIDPTDPNSPSDDAPWHSSPFLVALSLAGSRYNWVTSLIIAMFITSALSAASCEVFISSRYLYFLSRAGHAPKLFGKIYPDTERARARGTVVPVWGVFVTVCFAMLSYMCMRPKDNEMSDVEKVFRWISSMTTVASLQAWIGTLFTYYRFWRGTRHPLNREKYPNEISRILQVRARGQPFWAIYSFTFCCIVLIFNGWSLFDTKWVIYINPDSAANMSNPQDQVLKFLTTYVPLPVFLLLIFWYKLINQTRMKRSHEMDFSGVVWPTEEVVQKKGKGWLRRVWWWLVY